ncbi:MAG TPA: response regulator transcription factor [Ktedonobacterales bacterium]
MLTEAPAAQKRILVVDDESSIRDVLTRYLEREGYRVEVAADGPGALQATTRMSPDLIVLDLMLPGLDGLEVCHRLRAQSMVPIIMLTARDEEADKVRGFTTGADDYITKPFSPAELVLRVKAVLRRAEAALTPAQAQDDLLRFGSLAIAPAFRRVELAGRVVDLSAREFDLLLFLARHPGQVFTRSQLLQHVWDYNYFGDSSTVTVHISRLREKLEPDPTHPNYIKTVWGVGYKFEPAA